MLRPFEFVSDFGFRYSDFFGWLNGENQEQDFGTEALVTALPFGVDMIPIVSIVGRSDSGKTTLIERLVPALTQRGYRIATVKHDVHGFEMDREGKDSWRHKQAGASTVVLSSPAKMAVIKDLEEEQTLDEIRWRWIADADLILTEGYKRSRFPKVEVSLYHPEGELLCTRDDRLIAVVSDRSLAVDVPVFREGEVNRLADWLVGRFLSEKKKPSVQVFVNGKPMALNPFVQDLLWKIIRAFLSTLKGWGPGGNVEVRIAGEGALQPSSGGASDDHEKRRDKLSVEG